MDQISEPPPLAPRPPGPSGDHGLAVRGSPRRPGAVLPRPLRLLLPQLRLPLAVPARRRVAAVEPDLRRRRPLPQRLSPGPAARGSGWGQGRHEPRGVPAFMAGGERGVPLARRTGSTARSTWTERAGRPRVRRCRSASAGPSSFAPTTTACGTPPSATCSRSCRCPKTSSRLWARRPCQGWRCRCGCTSCAIPCPARSWPAASRRMARGVRTPRCRPWSTRAWTPTGCGIEADGPRGHIVVLDGYHPYWRAMGPEGPVPVRKVGARAFAIATPGGSRQYLLEFSPPWRPWAWAGVVAGALAALLLCIRSLRLDSPPAAR
jgi:hypothetical protein